ncbi:hypothetical protein GCM10029992_53250 [Glycomyces albus]
MPRPQPLSGFPELLPRQRIVEQQVVDHLRRAFELHGFANVQTRAVEPMEQLLRKGETSRRCTCCAASKPTPAAATPGSASTST